MITLIIPAVTESLSRPGSGGNLPAGEIFISPEIGVSEGVIVIDGSISCRRGVIITRTPITLDNRREKITAEGKLTS